MVFIIWLGIVVVLVGNINLLDAHIFKIEQTHKYVPI